MSEFDDLRSNLDQLRDQFDYAWEQYLAASLEVSRLVPLLETLGEQHKRAEQALWDYNERRGFGNG